MKAVFLACLLVTLASAKIFFQDKFTDGEEWKKRWIMSTAKTSEKPRGKVELSAGKFYNDAEKDKGLQTKENNKYYILSADMEEFSTKDMKKPLYIQYTVKHEQDIDCGGGYIKLLPKDAFKDKKDFLNDSTYNIMFGPDICGYSTKKVHVIFGKDGKNHLTKKEISCPKDTLTHLYTLTVFPNNTYEVAIDNAKSHTGSLEDDFDMVPPKKIDDPTAKKPEDWEDNAEIDDPNDKKPEDWDKTPKRIPDPKAKKPADWDDDSDGTWEAPMIDNPDYKGEWKPKRIPNPKYKGKWVPPQINNPEYVPNDHLYAYESFKYIGIEIWQVKSGTIFDNFLVTDDLEAVKAAAAEWKVESEGEKKMKEKLDEEKKKKEEEEKKKKEAEKKKDEDDDDDDDDDDGKKDKKEEKKDKKKDKKDKKEKKDKKDKKKKDKDKKKGKHHHHHHRHRSHSRHGKSSSRKSSPSSSATEDSAMEDNPNPDSQSGQAESEPPVVFPSAPQPPEQPPAPQSEQPSQPPEQPQQPHLHAHTYHPSYHQHHRLLFSK